MGKGFVKLYRAEADIPALWENAALFCTYQKLKILARWPEGMVVRSSRVLAGQLAMSVNTLRKAVEGLERLGLLEQTSSARNCWALRIKYAENETPENAPQIGPKLAAGVNLLNQPKNDFAPEFEPTAPGLAAPTQPNQPELFGTSDANFEPVGPENEQVVQNLIQSGAKFDTTLYQNLNQQPNIESNIYKYNIKPPYISPAQLQASGFTTFWDAYPNKKGKQRAIKKWMKSSFNLTEILPVLEKQKRLRDWVKMSGKFVPHADAYLNQRRWEDELPAGEEAYILDFKNPTTRREIVLRRWLEVTNASILNNTNQKINSYFENDREQFETIVGLCGGNIENAFKVMRHGWQIGCNSLRSICDKAAAYINELHEEGKL